MGLKPLEFTDCLTDSPDFRENLHAHEKELEKTSSQIKVLVKDVKEIINAATVLSKAQRALAESLDKFTFECIGTNQTDDEIVIAGSLRQFSNLISTIEDERDRMLGRAHEQFIKPLDDFRKKKIGVVKEGKKKFEKQTTKFCQSQERYLNLSTKKQDTILQEADASLEMEQRHFCQASLKYVFLLQEVQECKKYEFVETLLGFMYSWLTFYHQGHEVFNDHKPYMVDLQKRIQNTRENFETTRDQTKNLMNKMLELRKQKDPGCLDKTYARQGYLYLMEKKALGSSWTKYYCMYEKGPRKFSMIAYNQISGKTTSIEEIIIKSCIRRMSDSIDKRFCFDLTAENKPGVVFTLQALSDEDRRLWLDAMDGREPTYGQPGKISKSEETSLDEVGLEFVEKCITELESRGLEEQGLYRLVGVSSKVTKMMNAGLDPDKVIRDKLSLTDRCEWETKTITSALKNYLRNLPESLMTFRYHNAFIDAAKQDARVQRTSEVHALVHRLPPANFKLLDTLIAHLKKVAAKSEKNKMTVSNLGVCFGPTLLRPEEESVAAIIDIKFCNVVVEILIENYEKIFRSPPPVKVIPSMEQGDLSKQDYLGKPSSSSSSTDPSLKVKSKHKKQGIYSQSLFPAMPTRGQSLPQFQAPSGSSSHSHFHSHPPVGQRVSSNPSKFTSNVPLNEDEEEKAMFCEYPYEMQTSWEGFPLATSGTTAIHHSTATVNSLQSSSHSSSSNHSSGGEPVPLSFTLGSHASITDNTNEGRSFSGTKAQINKSVPTGLGDVKAPSFSQSFLNNSNGNDRNVSQSSSSSESVASWPGPQTGAPMLCATPPQPPPYQPPPELPISNGRDHNLRDASKASSSTGVSIWESGKTARTLYSCIAEHDGELSFEPNEIISNVHVSVEPGWLVGTLRGKTGLIPENYVQVLPCSGKAWE